MVCAPLLTCPSSVCQSTCPGLSVFCQLTAITQRIASSCHTMNASRPSGSYTALPCILSATGPCLFLFPVCLVYREMIPVLPEIQEQNGQVQQGEATQELALCPSIRLVAFNPTWKVSGTVAAKPKPASFRASLTECKRGTVL